MKKLLRKALVEFLVTLAAEAANALRDDPKGARKRSPSSPSEGAPK